VASSIAVVAVARTVGKDTQELVYLLSYFSYLSTWWVKSQWQFELLICISLSFQYRLAGKSIASLSSETVCILPHTAPLTRPLLCECGTFVQPVKKYPAFYGTQRFIAVFTRAHRPVPIWSQMNPVYTLPSHFHKIHFYVILLSAFRYSEWSLPFRLKTKDT
jgi:hypothetical protein